MAKDDIHIVSTAQNKIWHTIFFANGTNQNYYGDVLSQVTVASMHDLGTINSLDCAAEGATDLNFLVATNDGLWHTLRRTLAGGGSTWQPTLACVNDQETNPTDPGSFKYVRAASGGGIVQVVADAANPGPWHALRQADNHWQAAFGNISGPVPALAGSIKTACAADSAGRLYVLGHLLSGPNRVPTFILTVRDTNGGWWTPQTWTPTDFQGNLTALSLASDSKGNLMAVMANNSGVLFSAAYNGGKKQWPQSWQMLAPAGAIPSGPADGTAFMSPSIDFLSNGDVVLVVVADTAASAHLARATYRASKKSWTSLVNLNDLMTNGNTVINFVSTGVSVFKS